MPNFFLHKKSPLQQTAPHLKPNQGFTLIEVMVTTAIILMLSGFSFSVITSSQRSNRDTLRKTDLNNIQSALQQYYTDQSFYPSLSTSGLTPDSVLNNCLGNPNTCTANKTYLNQLPGDPAGNAAYHYVKLPAGCDNTTVDTRCYNYCIYTTLENPPTGFVSPSPSCPEFQNSRVI
jgi:prepilin-type N-terminal cleavage/methylation domain-containing protein